MLTRREVQDLLAALDGISWIMGMLLYGAGLRLRESHRLRLKDVDFGRVLLRVSSPVANSDATSGGYEVQRA